MLVVISTNKLLRVSNFWTGLHTLILFKVLSVPNDRLNLLSRTHSLSVYNNIEITISYELVVSGATHSTYYLYYEIQNI